MPAKLRQNRKPKRRFGEGGELLVELMVAMSVMVIGLLGVFAVLAQSLSVNRSAADQYVAAGLAAEGIEVVKNILDSNFIQGKPWNEGLNLNGDFGVQYNSTALDQSLARQFLKFDPASGKYSYDSGTPTRFIRTISISNLSANEIRVNSQVEWTDKSGQKMKLNLEDHFFNWKQ
jgi:Tfp pilus assembly protein PilV